MKNQDIRWVQRFRNFKGAFHQLASAAKLAQERGLSDLEQQGMIRAFEFTHELAWNVLKDYLHEQGITGIIGSKGATREAFMNGLLENATVVAVGVFIGVQCAEKRWNCRAREWPVMPQRFGCRRACRLIRTGQALSQRLYDRRGIDLEALHRRNRSASSRRILICKKSKEKRSGRSRICSKKPHSGGRLCANLLVRTSEQFVKHQKALSSDMTKSYNGIRPTGNACIIFHYSAQLRYCRTRICPQGSERKTALGRDYRSIAWPSRTTAREKDFFQTVNGFQKDRQTSRICFPGRWGYPREEEWERISSHLLYRFRRFCRNYFVSCVGVPYDPITQWVAVVSGFGLAATEDKHTDQKGGKDQRDQDPSPFKHDGRMA